MPKGVSWVGGWLECRLRFSCPCLRSIVVSVGAGGPEPIPECHFLFCRAALAAVLPT